MELFQCFFQPLFLIFLLTADSARNERVAGIKNSSKLNAKIGIFFNVITRIYNKLTRVL